MRIAYLVLAHANPAHLRRLVRALRSASAEVFVHIDKKARTEEFHESKDEGAVLLRRRVAVYWGEWSMVEATLALMREAMSSHTRYDYFVLLSGGDYPLRGNSYILHFFEENRGREFINIVRMPCDAVDKPISRLTTWQRRSERTIRNSLDRLFRRTEHRLLPWRSNARDYRQALHDLAPYAGSQWWALTREACGYILGFVRRERPLVRFFENTQIPDEMFFHTIIGNSPFLAAARRNLTYSHWPATGPGPSMIGEEQLALFGSSRRLDVKDAYGDGEVLFARKFGDSSGPIVDSIDRLRENAHWT